jgi:site-specific recombinase XerD
MEVFFTDCEFTLPNVNTKTGEIIEYPRKYIPFIITENGHIHEHATDWLYNLVINKGKDTSTVSDYAYRVAEFLRWCLAINKNYKVINKDDIGIYLSLKRSGNIKHEIKPIKNNTSNAINTSIRSFYSRLFEIGVISEIPNDKNMDVIRDYNEGMYSHLESENVKKSDLNVPNTKLRPKWKKITEISRFLENCSPVQLHLMASLMLESGLRREEAVLINIDVFKSIIQVPDDYPYMISFKVDAIISPTKNAISRYVLISPFLLNSIRYYISNERKNIIKKTSKRLNIEENQIGIVKHKRIPDYP